MNHEDEKPVEETASEVLPEEAVLQDENGSGSNRRKYTAIAAAVGAVLIVALVAGIWYVFFRAPGGQPVAAPRGVSFDGEKGGKAVTDEDRTITLTDDQLKAANLKFVEVGETIAGAASESTTTGVVKANDYEKTPVVSQVMGVVKSINADLGRFVRKGDTIAVVSSEQLAGAQADFLSRKAELDESQKRYKRALSLSEISEESRNELDATTAKLEAATAMLTETKVNFERSKKLSAIGAISKRELEKAETAYKTTQAEKEEAEKRFERAKGLLKINPARRNEIDSYLTMVTKNQAETNSLRERLLVLGLSTRRINALNSLSRINADLPIVSPVTGTVTERIANTGEVVSSNGKLAMITDLSTVWVIAQVFENELGKLRVGSGAGVSTDAYPGKYFRGNVSYIDPELDTSTRTAQVRIELPNAGQELKTGMYVKVAFSTLGGREQTMPLIPEAAVQFLGDEKVVFEATNDPKVFAIRTVSLLDKIGTDYPVKNGIFVGDKIVTDGSFLLRAEWLKTN